MSLDSDIARIALQEQRLRFDQFNEETAWDLGHVIREEATRYGLAGRATREMARVDHGFTHFSLSIYPVEITAGKIPLRAMEPGLIWQNLDDAMEAAIPAPVKRILKLVQSTHSSKR